MSRKIGAVIALDGEKDFKQAVSNVNSELKTLQSEAGLVTEKFKGQSNTTEALSEKHRVLSDTLEKQTEKYNEIEKGLKHAEESQKKVGSGLEELRKKLKGASEKMQEMENSSDTTAEELEKQRKEIEELNKTIKRGEDNYELAARRINTWQRNLNAADAELIRLNKELTQTERYMEEANRSTDGCAASIDEYGRAVQSAENDTRSLGNAVQIALGNLAANAITACFDKVADLSRQAISGIYEVGSGFEAQMSTVEALSGASGDALDSLNEKAKEVGATTKFTATEAGQGLEYMALAGWNVNEMLEGIDGVISATAASGLELSEVSDILTDAITAFGDSAQDANRYADVLATTQAKSNTTISALGEAYKNTAATAGAYGYSLESVSAALGAMANAGIKGSIAGTNLSVIMSRLATNTNGARDQLEALGIQFYNSDGSARDFNKVIAELCSAMSDMTTKEQASVATSIAGKNAQKSLNAIVNQGAEAYNALYDELMNCGGAAENMAETMNDNLNGKLTIMQSSLEAVGLSIFEHFQEPLKEAVESGTEGFEQLNDEIKNGELSENLDKLGKETGELAKQAIDFAINAIPKVTNGLDWIMDHGDEITSILKGIGAGLAVMAAAKGITKTASAFRDVKNAMTTVISSIQAMTTATGAATAAQEGLNAAQKANASGLMVSLIVGLGMAIYSYAKKTKDAADTTKEFREELSRKREAIQENIKNYENETQSVEAEWMANSRLVDKLYELNEVQDKTNSQKEMMKGMVEQLSGSVPELAEAYDEETSSLSMTKEAVEKLMEAKKEYAMAQARQNIMQGIAQEAAEAELAIAQTDAEIKKLKEEIKDLNYDIDKDKLLNGVENLSVDWSAVDDTSRQIDKLEEEKEKLNETLKAANERFEFAAEGAESYGDSLEDLSETEAKTASNTVQTTEAQAEAYEKLKDTISQSVESSISALNEFDGGTEITAEKVRDNLQSQIDGVSSWAANMEKLAGAAGKGMSKEFYDYLAEMGPQSANLVQSLADALEGNTPLFTEICKNWTAAMDLEGPITEEVASFSTALGKQEEYMKLWQQKAQEEASKAGKEWVKRQSDGMTSETESVNEAGKAVKDAAKNPILESYAEFNEMGLNMSKGVAEGIKAGAPEAESAAGNLTAGVMDVMKNNMKIHSPSQEMRDKIGIMIARGVSTGIAEGIPEARTSAAELCAAIFETSVKVLDIHSPSKVFKDKVGAHISNGIAVGISSKKGEATKAFKSLANNVNKSASSWLNTYKKTHEVSLEDEKYFWNKIAGTVKKGTTAYKTALQKAANIDAFEKNVREKVSNCFNVSQYTTNSKGEQEKKAASDYYSEIYSAASKYFDNYSIMHNVSLQQEEYYWQQVLKKLKKGTQAYYDATKKLKELQKQRKQEAADTKASNKEYALSGDALSKYKTYYEVSERAEVQYWNIVRKKFKAGTAERIEADQKYYEAKENYNSKLEDLNQEYYDNCKEVQDRLKDDIQDLTDAYNDAVAERKDSIYSSFGLFDQFESKSASGQTLLYNLKSQVAGYADWEKQLSELGGKNILSEELLAELSEMGPEASASIHALNQLSEAELKEYQQLWEQKNQLAESQAVKDNETLKKQTEEKIALLKTSAQQELDAYKEEYKAAKAEVTKTIEEPLKELAKNSTTLGEDAAAKLIAGIKKGATKKSTAADLKTVSTKISKGLGDLPAAGKTIGDNTLQGIIDGLTNKKKIDASAKDMINALKKSLQKAADIHSPSRLFKKEIGVQLSAGVAEGIKDRSAQVNTAGEDMIKSLLEKSKRQLERQQTALSDYAASIQSTAGIAELNSLISIAPVQQVTANIDNTSLAAMFGEMIAVMQEGFDRLGNMQLVADTGALIGETSAGMSEAFARSARRLR